MSTNDTPAQESAATTDATSRLLAQHVYLGRDSEGYHHHLDRAAERVTRFDADGTVERRTDITGAGDTELDRYLRFVAAEVGWADRRQLAVSDVFPEAR